VQGVVVASGCSPPNRLSTNDLLEVEQAAGKDHRFI
jgi:hypothetical protein